MSDVRFIIPLHGKLVRTRFRVSTPKEGRSPLKIVDASALFFGDLN